MNFKKPAKKDEKIRAQDFGDNDIYFVAVTCGQEGRRHWDV